MIVTFLALVPMILFLYFGFSLSLSILNDVEKDVIVIWFYVLIIGACLIITPSIFWSFLFEINHTVLLRYLTLFYIFMSVILTLVNFPKFKLYFLKCCYDLNCFIRKSTINKIGMVFYLSYMIKTFFITFYFPINDVNALVRDLPYSIVYYLTGNSGPLASQNGINILYTWAMAITSNTIVEPFRSIAFIFTVSFPIVIYYVTKKIFTDDIGIISLSLSSMSPLLDYGLFLFNFSSDFMAMIYGFIGLYFLIKRDEHYFQWAGFALGVSLIAKPPYGIPFIILSTYVVLISLKNKISALTIFIMPVSIFILSYIIKFSKYVYGNQYMNFIISVTIFSLSIAISSYISNNEINLIEYKKIYYSMLGLVTPFIFALIQIRLGGSPFEISLFPTLQSSAVTWWNVFSNSFLTYRSLSYAFTESRSISYLFPTIALYHPLFDPFLIVFKIIGLIYLFKRKNIMLSLFLFAYSLYLFTMGPYANARHMIVFLPFLIPVISSGIYEYSIKYTKSKLSISIILVLVIITSMLYSTSFANFTSQTPILKNLVSGLSISPPYFSYVFPENIANLPKILIVGVFMSSLLIIVINQIKNIKITFILSKSLRKISFLKNTAYVLLILLLIYPTFQYSWVKSNGNLTMLEKTQVNWYLSSQSIANQLEQYIPDNETLLTFHFPAPYYLVLNRIDFLDLSYGLSYSYPQRPLSDYSIIQQMIQANSFDVLMKIFSNLHIRYVLFPSSSYWDFGVFTAFSEMSPMMDVLAKGNLRETSDFGIYILYEVSDTLTNTGFEEWENNIPKNWLFSKSSSPVLCREDDIVYKGNHSLQFTSGEHYGSLIFKNVKLTNVQSVGFALYPSTINKTYETFIKSNGKYYYYNIIVGASSFHSIGNGSTLIIQNLNKWSLLRLPVSNFSTSTQEYFNGGIIDQIGFGAYTPNTIFYIDDISVTFKKQGS